MILLPARALENTDCCRIERVTEDKLGQIGQERQGATECHRLALLDAELFL